MISKGRVIRLGLFFAIANFLLTASIGAMLRFNTISPFPELIERYWIHAHSHVGFLGWVFMALFILAFAMLLPKGAIINRRVYRLLIYMQISVMGMLVTFPFMGYAAPSILFSTFHMVLSVIFVLMYFKYVAKDDLSGKFMKAGLVFMLLSGIGPLALGPIIIGGFRESDWYDMAIYYYLHFQYNGWFTMGVFALLFKFLEQQPWNINISSAKLIYKLLVIGIIMTLALSALGFGLKTYAQVVGFIGAILQLIAGFLLLKVLFLKSGLGTIIHNSFARWFFGMALFSWLLKIMMQFLSAIPLITDFVYLSRDAIMTYLHLSFLGFTSCFVIGLLLVKGYLSTKSLFSRMGYILFIAGVVLMGVSIGLRSIPQYIGLDFLHVINYLLFSEAALIFLALILILFYGFILSHRVTKHRYIS